VHCRPGAARQLAAIWVGLGGFVTRQKLEQIGVDVGCDRNGNPSYSAWFELVPYPAYSIARPVGAGDVVSASVEVTGGWAELRLADATRHWAALRRVTWPLPDTSSAEWIVEAPGSCVRSSCQQAPLADFGTVTMLGIHAVDGAVTGSLADRAWKVSALRIVPGHLTGTLGVEEPVATVTPDRPTGSPAGAVPGPVSADGSAFTIRWVPDASP